MQSSEKLRPASERLGVPFICLYRPSRLTNVLVDECTVDVCALEKWTILTPQGDRAVDIDEGSTRVFGQNVSCTASHVALIPVMYQGVIEELEHTALS